MEKRQLSRLSIMNENQSDHSQTKRKPISLSPLSLRGHDQYADPSADYRQGLLYLHLVFSSHLAADMRLKLLKFDDGPQNPQWDVVKTVSKIFKHRNKGAKV